MSCLTDVQIFLICATIALCFFFACVTVDDIFEKYFSYRTNLGQTGDDDDQES